MASFKIDDEIRSLMRSMTEDEDRRLEIAIKTDGCRDKVTVGLYPGITVPVLIDGHNRVRICRKFRLPYATGKTLKFESRAALKQWVVSNQLARRNLTEEQIAYYLGLKYLIEKESHGDAERLENKGSAPSGQNVHLGTQKTAERIAEESGVDEKTVRRAAEFAAAVDAIGEKKPELKQEILAGTADMSRSEVIALAAGNNGKKKKAKKSKPKATLVEKDEWGIPIQDHAKEAFEAVPRFKELVAAIQHAQKLFNETANLAGGKFLTLPDVSSYRRGKKDDEGEHADRFVHEGLERAYQQVKNAMPTHTVCPWNYVDAPHPKNCATCKNLNWTPPLGKSIPKAAINRAVKELAAEPVNE